MRTKRMKMSKSNIIKEMLTENTGRSVLDSGGENGRYFEKNRGRKFEEEPEATMENDGGTVSYTKNIYHFLMDELGEPVAELQHQFEKFAETPEQEENCWFTNLNDFLKQLDDWKFITTVNTYNEEDCLLSQVIQYTSGEWNGMIVSAVSIHNGCDIRGGYTKPVFFENLTEGWLDTERASVYCSHCATCWETGYGNGVFTVEQAGCSHRDPVDIPVEVDTALYGKIKGTLTVKCLNDYEVVNEKEHDGSRGIIVETENGLRCPVCGKGILE